MYAGDLRDIGQHRHPGGISHFKPLTELSIKEFDRLMATNLRPVFITSRQLALHRQQNGNQQCDCIINLCSTRYLHSEAGTEAYSASKGETSIIHDGLTAEDLRCSRSRLWEQLVRLFMLAGEQAATGRAIRPVFEPLRHCMFGTCVQAVF